MTRNQSEGVKSGGLSGGEMGDAAAGRDEQPRATRHALRRLGAVRFCHDLSPHTSLVLGVEPRIHTGSEGFMKLPTW